MVTAITILITIPTITIVITNAITDIITVVTLARIVHIVGKDMWEAWQWLVHHSDKGNGKDVNMQEAPC